MSVRGFILQPTYRTESGKPVVYLFGRLETGETFLVRDNRQVPHFYIAETDRERARKLGVESLAPSERVNFAGQPVTRVVLRKPSDTPPLRDRLTQGGVRCYEADVRFAMRLLIDRGIQGSLAIQGEWQAGERIHRIYRNPELAPADWSPELQVLSIDIETDPKIRRLLSVALHGCGASEVLLFSPEGYDTPEGAVGFSSERDLLHAFCERFRELDPDVVTGWNVVDFDLRVLLEMAQRFRMKLDLGRGSGRVHIRESRMAWSSNEVIIPGRVVADGIHLVRGAFIQMGSYALDAVAKEVLGEGKVVMAVPGRMENLPSAAPDRNKAQQLLDTFKHDRERFVRYNLTDARLVTDILTKLRLLDLAIERSRLTGLPVDRTSGSIAAFDFLYLSELHRRGVVAPSVDSESEGVSAGLGGYVMEPVTGLHHNVLVFDFKSLYPSLIRTFQIDPLGYLPPGASPVDDDGSAADPIVAPNGARFRRRPGVLTEMLDHLFPRREAAKQRGDDVGSYAIKILMNSFYGVLGARACRFYRPEVASAITSFGQEVLRWSMGRIEHHGHQVLYGDTDSLFVLSGEADPQAALEVGHELAETMNRDVAEWLDEKWRVESRLELELEKLYRQLMLPPMRGGGGGARKRYVGLVGEGDEAEVIFTGMEVVRRDWTDLAKNVQRELYRRLFDGEELEEYLSLVVHNLRHGRLDDLLVYRKGLRKSLDQYTATTPPHVAAARKSSRKLGRVISYVMTRDGAEPAEERRSPFDHEHYVQKQIRPVAEPVLAILGLDFDRVIGDDGQLELF
ncbi:MAG: DNA polymerase II [Acidobacteriota bacterium]